MLGDHGPLPSQSTKEGTDASADILLSSASHNLKDIILDIFQLSHSLSFLGPQMLHPTELRGRGHRARLPAESHVPLQGSAPLSLSSTLSSVERNPEVLEVLYPASPFFPLIPEELQAASSDWEPASEMQKVNKGKTLRPRTPTTGNICSKPVPLMLSGGPCGKESVIFPLISTVFVTRISPLYLKAASDSFSFT
ncbi:hypothetical protein Y1Q_0022418 [Alligator mississippiensis]|uniref:Uncharacterized protein n=1 Tax=Alligator mississippiensis TaxID=8496 RepID=A0A151N052_ALLMI|nr:hypothetical protein Y1Q_0022418 [Alligator mississippiensis]